MVFGWFLAKRTTVLLRGQCHAHLFFCKKPARLQLSLCARSSKLSSQQHQCSYSLCTASNSTLAPAAQQQQAPVAAASRTIAQAASTTRISLDFRGRQVLLYILLLPMVLLCTRKGSSFYATSILVYIYYYTLWKSRLCSNRPAQGCTSQLGQQGRRFWPNQPAFAT